MDDLRNQVLSELIDKMHGRLADKMYPEQEKAEAPVAEVEQEAAPAASEEPADDDMSDSDIDEILKNC